MLILFVKYIKYILERRLYLDLLRTITMILWLDHIIRVVQYIPDKMEFHFWWLCKEIFANFPFYEKCKMFAKNRLVELEFSFSPRFSIFANNSAEKQYFSILSNFHFIRNVLSTLATSTDCSAGSTIFKQKVCILPEQMLVDYWMIYGFSTL